MGSRAYLFGGCSREMENALNTGSRVLVIKGSVTVRQLPLAFSLVNSIHWMSFGLKLAQIQLLLQPHTPELVSTCIY